MRTLEQWQARLEELSLMRRRLENETNAYLTQVNGRLAMIDANITDVNNAIENLQRGEDADVGRSTVTENGHAAPIDN